MPMWVGSSIARKRTCGLFAAHPTMNSRDRAAGDICMLPITSSLAARFAHKDGGARAH
jgi:hypothetical protein